ncbi:MAG: hypothetical protein LUQ50_06900 [Methanospirillum sp.]|uniref:hypothetical protein n=1 Tax=Methanospirillum sp. TaxID=45200 RepID=UPI0023692240|nr:hypothetical protein [Methanospirillum sp.]MDD1728783.1 hypothetical protein [Methanospirillum sp.]
MNVMSVVAVISLVMAVSNGIAMILTYQRYASVVRGVFMANKVNKAGKVEIVVSSMTW